ncbi:phage major tropism determinant [Brucella pituitosa]
MTTAVAAMMKTPTTIGRAKADRPIIQLEDPCIVSIRAGTSITIDGSTVRFDKDMPIASDQLLAGKDYAIGINAMGELYIKVADENPLNGKTFAGFHFAPSGNATGKNGGDGVPAINPYSLWDIGFRPSCPDPRGMAIVETAGGKLFWADIYLLGVNHVENGTSKHGITIADGRDLPVRIDGEGTYERCHFATVSEIYAHHGKRLLGAEEFFAAAYGVKERASRDDEPTLTGSLEDNAARFISRWGLFDVTGTMWQWGTDGHPDDPRPSIFGGSWLNGSDAGSRYAHLGAWAEASSEYIGARGASDHLKLD